MDSGVSGSKVEAIRIHCLTDQLLTIQRSNDRRKTSEPLGEHRANLLVLRPFTQMIRPTLLGIWDLPAAACRQTAARQALARSRRSARRTITRGGGELGICRCSTP